MVVGGYLAFLPPAGILTLTILLAGLLLGEGGHDVRRLGGTQTTAGRAAEKMAVPQIIATMSHGASAD